MERNVAIEEHIFSKLSKHGFDVSEGRLKVGKKKRCPSTEEWIKKMWYIYSAEKNNNTIKFAGKWKELENIIPTEVTQTQKDKHSVHCNESLVWLEASGFCHTIDIGLSLGLPLGYPVVALCRGDPAALGLRDVPLHVFQQIIYQLIAPALDLDNYKALTAIPHPHHPCELSSVAPVNSPYAARSKVQCQFNFYALRVVPPTPTPPGPALPCGLGKVQGLLSRPSAAASEELD
ncbi:hypothetical protein STEG23_020555 [Scotinomys teguina]